MGRVFASSDWHGCGNSALKIFDFLKSDDTLFFLGDAIDRGPDGILLMDRLLNDKRVTYLKGNHEEMMACDIPERIKYPDGEFWFNDCTWFNNGGNKTWETIKNCSDEIKMSYINKINNMPLEVKYNSPKGHVVILEHAGYTPFDIPHRHHDPLWDREHFYDNWTFFDEVSEQEKNTYLVHGHTPVQYLKFHYGYKDQPQKTKRDIELRHTWDKDPNYKPSIIRYCGGHKFDIDMCTIVSNRIALIDLDTFEEIYFDAEDK